MPGNYRGIPPLGGDRGNKSALNTFNILGEQRDSNGGSLGGCCCEPWRILVSHSVAFLMCLGFFPRRSFLLVFIVNI